ncbi:MAG: hypothetical protein IJW42_01020 [Alistipes sp.]|nr:hypothetical protein [Alistipes sp.]
MIIRLMRTKHLGLLISFIFISIFLSSCNPPEDKIIITHTITAKKTVCVYKDSVVTSKIVCKLNRGDKVFRPDATSNGMARVALQEFGSQVGYIDKKYISSDTTIITHSSVLRDEYGLEIVPNLDETFDYVAQSYLGFFPVKKTNFWIFAIILVVGIVTFSVISYVKTPIWAQLLAFALVTPFALWVAFNIQQYNLSQIDGNFYCLIIILAFLALTVFMTTALTASVGKLIGRDLALKSTIWSCVSVFLIYFCVAFVHSLSDLSFKFGLFIYAAIILYYVYQRAILIKREKGLGLKALWLLLLYIVELIISIVLINIIMIPMQVVSSILIAQLVGAFMVIYVVVQFMVGVFSTPVTQPEEEGKEYEWREIHGLRPGVSDDWYDSSGNVYEETASGKLRKKW